MLPICNFSTEKIIFQALVTFGKETLKWVISCFFIYIIFWTFFSSRLKNFNLIKDGYNKNLLAVLCQEQLTRHCPFSIKFCFWHNTSYAGVTAAAPLQCKYSCNFRIKVNTFCTMHLLRSAVLFIHPQNWVIFILAHQICITYSV